MIICLEFDGVLYAPPALESPETELQGLPLPGSIEWMESALNIGHTVYISSPRFNQPGDSLKFVMAWLKRHSSFVVFRIQEPKVDGAARCFLTAFKPKADIYIDPKGFRFEGKWPSLAILQQ